MQIVISVIVGLFVGVVVRLLFPAKNPGGVVTTMVLGLGGAGVVSGLARVLGLYGADQLGHGVLASLIGALVVLGAYRLTPSRRLAP